MPGCDFVDISRLGGEPEPEPPEAETPPDERSATRPPAAPTLRRSLSSTFSLAGIEKPAKQPKCASRPALGQMLVVVPTLWIAAWLWIFWNALKLCLGARTTTPNRRRTALVTGGGTIQALHLARNLHLTGKRVVVVELEGHFALAKFSAAVDKVYSVEKPRADDPLRYARALRDIALAERADYFVPTSASSSAYYDAVAKPLLEAVGCACFVPDVEQVVALDDIARLMSACSDAGEPTPKFRVVESKHDVHEWYEGERDDGKHFMASVGALGVVERVKFIVPADKADFHLQREISAERPWVIVRDQRGEHYLTCTTVKESRVVANVTCRIDPRTKGLSLERNKEVDAWLRRTFDRLRASGETINGHVAFRFAKETSTGRLLPLGAKVGVSLPYMCYTSAHPRLLWRTCPHKSQEPTWTRESEWLMRHPGVEVVSGLIGKVLDKREALFAYWDPLPYCAYYQTQLPFCG